MERVIFWILVTCGLMTGIYIGLSWFVLDQSLVAKSKTLDTYPTEFSLQFESVTFNPVNDIDINLRGVVDTSFGS